MQLYWHISAAVVSIATLLIKENSCVPAIRPVSQRGIIFPVENWDDCFLDEANTQPGVCKTLEECPDIHNKWIKDDVYPKTCYFIKKEQFVCCPNTTSVKPPKNESIFLDFTTTELPVIKRKPSELECDLQNQQKFENSEVNNDGKTSSKRNEFSFMAALGWKSKIDNKIWYPCGGVLISKKFILTAAHCADIDGETPAFVRIGAANLNTEDGNTIKIDKFIKFPGYNISTVYNDIALVELEKEVNNSIVCLWHSEAIPFSKATALGYGGPSSVSLLKSTLNIVEKEECQQFYKLDDKLKSTDIIDSHICADDSGNIRECQGDSGGPLIMEFDKVYYVLGITSFGLGCAGLPPSIYTRVSCYVDWIESIIWPNIDIRVDV